MQWIPKDKKEPQEQELVSWRNAAIRVGEDLCSVGPFGYYDMTAKQWLDWALSVVTVHAPPPQPNSEQEPVAWRSWNDKDKFGFWDTKAEAESWCDLDFDSEPLYTIPPPQREWVGLTDEERDHFEGLHLYAARNQVEAWIEGVPAFIDAIEAKLREKNGIKEET